jgi:hypothetical protein
LPEDGVRAALLADYVASGARANPRSLQGYLPPRVAPTGAAGIAGAGLNQRQQRHGVVALDAAASS